MVPHAGFRILCTIQNANQANAGIVTDRKYHVIGLLRIMRLLAMMDESGAAVK